jgi:hypothetical protein
MTTRKEYVDKPIKFLLQSAYSVNKGLRWRRKQLGLAESDVKDERFRQCLLSNYLSLKAYLLVVTRWGTMMPYGTPEPVFRTS